MNILDTIIAANISAEQFIGMSGSDFAAGLAIRYDNRIKSILAVFWIVLFIFVNLTSILYLGALSLQTIFNVKLVYGIWGLALFALVYTVGMFWKKTTSRAALWGILVSIIVSVGLKYGFPGMPFLDQIVAAFLAVTVFMVLFSLMDGKMANDPRVLIFEAGLFSTGKLFNITATLIIVILLVLYILFW
jgi:Na+/proline symporter